jgi:PAS domain S-box-containing protein
MNIIPIGGPVEPHVVQRYRFIPSLAAPFTIAVGGLVLVGWLLGIRMLTSVFPNYATIKPNTASCFILAGLSLWLLRLPSGRAGNFSSKPGRMGQICALSVALVGLLTLAEYLLNLNFGMDQTLLRDIWTDPRVSPPGRMSIATAFGFFMLGASLFLVGRKSPLNAMVSQILALVILGDAVLTCAGYVYGVHDLHAVSFYSAVGVHTALVFILLCVGTLFARPDRGLIAVFTSGYSGGQMARLILPLALTLPFFIGWLRLKGEYWGLYGTEFGLALFATSNIIVFTILLWISAKSLNKRAARLVESAHAYGAEKTLRDQALILDLANDAMFIRDREDRITYWNQGAQRLYDFTKEEAVGHMTCSLLSTKYPQSFDNINAQLLATGHWEGELVHTRRDGALVTVSSNWTLQRDDSNRPVSVIEMNCDITARKKTEKELEKNREHLSPGQG